jgi:hypothetical protein
MSELLHYKLNTKADKLIYNACSDLGIDPVNANDIYINVYRLRDKLQAENDLSSIAVGTTGTITERLCEAALISINSGYGKLPNDWKWVGDFYIESIPFNVIVSVKSFKAKERLLSSGSGNYLSPTIGFGLFNDSREFRFNRVAKYPFRAFIAIYMPKDTYDQLDTDVQSLKNINNRPFIRKIEDFPEDLSSARDKKHKLDITKF